MKLDLIYNKDCENMFEVDDNSIDLIVSGPPYWDYIDYEGYAKGNDKYTWVQNNTYQSYLDKLKIWYLECYRVLAPGRYCIVNIGTVRKDNRTYPLPFHAVTVLVDLCFDFSFDIIWHKVAGGRMHARNFIHRPYPGYYRPNNKIEYLLVFQKKPEVPFTTDKIEQCKPANMIKIDSYFKHETANNVWHILPSSYPLNGHHPCPFPPEIPYRLISLFSLEGETVLDPFMGIGTTARAAKALKRRYIGYEIEEKFIEVAYESLDKPLHFRKPVKCMYSDKKR